MKLSEVSKALVLMGISSVGFAGTMGPAALNTPGKFYASVFGGAGTSNHFDVKQYGTAYFSEDTLGGPLAVNAFGTIQGQTVGFVGGNVGYQWPSLNLFNFQTGLTPAIELEGYYLAKSTYIGHELNNNTTRLPEHDFLVSYPMDAGIFLINTVANFDLSAHPRFHPYVGGGIGGGVLSISNAQSTQVSPPEAGVNHYNSNPNSSASTFAAQVKAGLSFELCKNLSLFGEYRWLYLANSNFTFGSTVYTGHAETSSWLVNWESQGYNLGAVGVRLSV